MLEQREETETGRAGEVLGFAALEQPWRGQKFKTLQNKQHLKSQEAEHGSADGKGGNLALPLKAELFGRVNGQQLIKPFLLCVL